MYRDRTKFITRRSNSLRSITKHLKLLGSWEVNCELICGRGIS